MAEGLGLVATGFDVVPGVTGELLDVLFRVAGLAHRGDSGEHDPEGVALAGHGDSYVGGYPEVGLRRSATRAGMYPSVLRYGVVLLDPRELGEDAVVTVYDGIMLDRQRPDVGVGYRIGPVANSLE